jgi:large subunit ribosomal protein L18
LKKIRGTTERPRLAVFKSNKHIYGQIIDDTFATTLAFSSTLDKQVAEKIQNLSPKEAAFVVGENLGEKAKAKNLEKIVFDRGSKPYQGRIQQLADGARKQGLVF